jgi:hypothetical protein
MSQTFPAWPRQGAGQGTLPWIGRAPGTPYFQTEHGEAWTPVGQNDSFTWDEWAPLRAGDLAATRRHLDGLRASGVTVLRLMLEYAQHENAWFEQPAGVFNPVLVRLWDDLFTLCEQTGMRILLTPYDTFFQWNRFDAHPYNQANGGPCAGRDRMMTCPDTRRLIRARLRFAAERWGGSGALFAWDLWNEMHPAQGENRPDCFADYIDDIGPFLRAVEIAAYGRAHPHCVSVFGPELGWKPWLNEPVFRHPALDFASSHFYEEGTIDHPADTVAPALAVGRLVREALAEITDDRPFFDSEHGPIHTFKDHGRTLEAAFDDEYFRHIQWAHLASGGAGGGMRWPNRFPHQLTPGMRDAQRALTGFLDLIDWTRFIRRNLWDEAGVDTSGIALLACGDSRQAVAWLLRTDALLPDGRVDPDLQTTAATLRLPMRDGPCVITPWDTRQGRALPLLHGHAAGGLLRLALPAFAGDLALAIRALE